MPVHIERWGHVKVITNDHAGLRNVLSNELAAGIVTAIDPAEADDGVGALVITGAGKPFRADADLIDRAVEHATRAADAPRELAIRTKATLREAHGTADHDAALAYELHDQVWSFGQPWFAERTGR